MSRRPPTQCERVLRALSAAGRHGVSQLDFDPPACDGRAPVRRLASRIADLRADGHRIDSTQRRSGMALYRLVGSPEEPAEAPRGPQEERPAASLADVVGELLAAGEGRLSTSPYDVWSDWS